MPIIDAHQHFWDPAGPGDFQWLEGAFAAINRRFMSADLRPSLDARGVKGTVLVQTMNDEDETRAFLDIAETTDFVAGVVGWVDLASPDVGDRLSRLRAGPGGRYLVGIRHLIHHETDPNWLAGSRVVPGLAAVEEAGLVYDFVPNLPQLHGCIEVAERFPNLRFVLDHISKPDIRGGGFDEWARPMRAFAKERDHVWCKLSGMVTEADWSQWSVSDLKPYVHEALDIFGVERCMFGSDWPVCLVAANYERVFDALQECLQGLGTDEKRRIFGGNAVEAYRLPDPGSSNTV